MEEELQQKAGRPAPAPAPAPSGGKLLSIFDGSADSCDRLRLAIELARRRNSIVVVAALVRRPAWTYFAAGAPLAPPPLHDQLVAALTKKLAAALADVPADVSIRIQVIEWGGRRSLRNRLGAEEFDLVFDGAPSSIDRLTGWVGSWRLPRLTRWPCT